MNVAGVGNNSVSCSHITALIGATHIALRICQREAKALLEIVLCLEVLSNAHLPASLIILEHSSHGTTLSLDAPDFVGPLAVRVNGIDLHTTLFLMRKKPWVHAECGELNRQNAFSVAVKHQGYSQVWPRRDALAADLIKSSVSRNTSNSYRPAISDHSGEELSFAEPGYLRVKPCGSCSAWLVSRRH